MLQNQLLLIIVNTNLEIYLFHSQISRYGLCDMKIFDKFIYKVYYNFKLKSKTIIKRKSIEPGSVFSKIEEDDPIKNYKY
jgi:hypothetical protein